MNFHMKTEKLPKNSPDRVTYDGSAPIVSFSAPIAPFPAHPKL